LCGFIEFPLVVTSEPINGPDPQPVVIAMSLPPLYKYLDVQGARRTLTNRTFRHAKPSTFNDTEDLTIRSIFPEDEETALEQLKHGFVDVLMSQCQFRR